MKKKKAQFYLIAAVIIIVILVGFATVTNYVRKGTGEVKIYNLEKELNIESSNVLDYGTYSEYDNIQMKELVEDFIDQYAQYVGEEQNVYFIFGNKVDLVVIAWDDLLAGTVSVDFGGGGAAPIILEISTRIKEKKKIQQKPDTDFVTIIIGDFEREFELSGGENFYFVLIEEIEGEQHVVTG